MSDHDLMGLALEQAREAARLGEIPVGAVLCGEGGEVVAVGCNRTITDHDPTAHAEVVALRRAGQALGTYRFPGLSLYVTLEPCVMCAMAMVHARLGRVCFGAFDPRTGALGSAFSLLTHPGHNHHYAYVGGIRAGECAELLRGFFRARREMQREGRDWMAERGMERFWERQGD